MSLVIDKKGNVLLEFHTGTHLDIPESEQAIPMPLALVAAKYQGKVLLVFNQWRKVWELPGGIIEADETPDQAAIRELAEESGQHAMSVDYVGWMKFRLKPDDRLELGVLYACELTQIEDFEANEETSKVMFWDMTSAIEGEISEIDAYLAKLV